MSSQLCGPNIYHGGSFGDVSYNMMMEKPTTNRSKVLPKEVLNSIGLSLAENICASAASTRAEGIVFFEWVHWCSVPKLPHRWQEVRISY